MDIKHCSISIASINEREKFSFLCSHTSFQQLTHHNCALKYSLRGMELPNQVLCATALFIGAYTRKESPRTERRTVLRIYICSLHIDAHMRLPIYSYKCLFTLTDTYTCLYSHMHTHIYAHTQAYTYTQIHVHTYTHTYMYIYTHTCAHVWIHSHMYAHLEEFQSIMLERNYD